MQKHPPVVIAESDYLVGRLFIASLQAAGQVAAIGEDGEAVLKLIEKHSPSVVVVNMNLSRPNGLELLRSLYHTNKDLKILSITSPGQSEMKAAANAMGVDGFLELPFAPAEFAQRVKQILEA